MPAAVPARPLARPLAAVPHYSPGRSGLLRVARAPGTRAGSCPANRTGRRYRDARAANCLWHLAVRFCLHLPLPGSHDSEPLELSIQREASSSKRRLSSNVPAGTCKIHSSSSVQHLIHQSIHDRQIRRLTTRHLRDHATSRATVRLAIALSELLCKHAAHAAVTDRVATLSDPRDE
jgi:hypothetical protein